MMKKGLLLIIVLFSSLQICAQCISVNLSIHWKKGENLFSVNEDSIYIPYLDVTYQNLSDKEFYFLRVAQNRNGFLPIPLTPSTSKRVIPPDKLIEYDDYSQGQYAIKLICSPFFASALEIALDTIDINEEHEMDVINDVIFHIHDYLSKQKKGQIIDKKWIYLSSDITPEKILNEFNDKFVFLKPGETYVDTFNLIAFKLVKGTFTFYVDSYLKSYVYVSAARNKGQSIFTYDEIPLPLKVGDYKLYSDSIATNTLTIRFK